MIYQTSDRNNFNSLVATLRKKLRNFFVINQQGDRIGTVQDIIVDRQKQLQLLVASTIENSAPNIQVNSKQIQKIEIADKVVVIDFTIITSEEIERDTAQKHQQTQQSRHGESSLRLGDRSEIAAKKSLTKRPELEQVELLAPMDSEIRKQTEIQLDSPQELAPEEIIKLLAERVVVERRKRKIGEVIVRKEIETRLVEVPVRYEKLIVEQVNPERQQIAEINLGEETITARQVNFIDPDERKQSGDKLTVRGRFDSPKIASLLLNAIARERQHGCQQIRLEIIVDTPEKQKTYQEWCDRCSQ